VWTLRILADGTAVYSSEGLGNDSMSRKGTYFISRSGKLVITVKGKKEKKPHKETFIYEKEDGTEPTESLTSEKTKMIFKKN
jgi:hypothetical protein